MKRNVLKLMVVIVITMGFSVSYMMPCSYASPADDKRNFREQDQKSMNNYNEYVNSQKNVNTKTTTGSGQFSANDYKPSSPGDVVGGSKLLGKINIVLGWVNNIAIMASVLVLSIIGIKYMVGSVEEKAEYKKNMKPYLVGCVLAFGITTILKIISSVAQTLN